MLCMCEMQESVDDTSAILVKNQSRNHESPMQSH